MSIYIEQRVWTQILSPLKSHKFESPIYQNQKHLDALRTVLGVAGEHLRPVITFVGPSTFATPMPDNVTRGLGFLRHIKLFRVRCSAQPR
ncbi:Nuclease OS=Stutzerimonas stutzeri OX=316 GN=GQA94_06145 PE=4 SV=1 [Stutzerimonas stutzeri]